MDMKLHLWSCYDERFFVVCTLIITKPSDSHDTKTTPERNRNATVFLSWNVNSADKSDAQEKDMQEATEMVQQHLHQRKSGEKEYPNIVVRFTSFISMRMKHATKEFEKYVYY